MDIWLDNTGFQSAGKLLISNETDDLNPVYQLATTIVFSNSLTLTGFENFEVGSMTANIIEALDPKRNLIDVRKVDQHTYFEQCRKSAEFCGTNFERTFTLSSDTKAFEYPASLSRKTIQKQIEMGIKVIFTDDPSELSDLCQLSQKKMAAGAVVYMLAINSDLRRKSKQILIGLKDKWLGYRQIENFLRYHLNIQLAQESNEAIYLPAIGRARLIRKSQKAEYHILKKQAPSEAISNMLDSFQEDIRLGAPSMYRYFKHKCNDNADYILKTAFELRIQTSELRKKLTNRLKNIYSSSSYNHALNDEIKEISTNIEMNLGLKPAPTLAGAFDISLVTAIPPVAITLSGKELNTWWNFKRSTKRNSLLTEISRQSYI